MKICFISAVKKVLALTAVIAVASVFAGRECVKVGKTDVYLLETGGISIISKDYPMLFGEVMLTTDGWNNKYPEMKNVKGKEWTYTLNRKLKNNEDLDMLKVVKQSSPGVFDASVSWKSVSGKNPKQAYCQISLSRDYKKINLNGEEITLLQRNKYEWFSKKVAGFELKFSATGASDCVIKSSQECYVIITTLASGFQIKLRPVKISDGLKYTLIVK